MEKIICIHCEDVPFAAIEIGKSRSIRCARCGQEKTRFMLPDYTTGDVRDVND